MFVAMRVFKQLFFIASCVLVFFLFAERASAQSSILFLLASKHGVHRTTRSSEALVLHSRGDEIKLTTLKFYISGIELYRNDTVVWKEAVSFHLCDFISDSVYEIHLPNECKGAVNQIRFFAGIDSATHAAGAKGAALDPVNGMYWAWHSGYINFKIEGSSARAPGPKHEFQFHLGGFRK